MVNICSSDFTYKLRKSCCFFCVGQFSAVSRNRLQWLLYAQSSNGLGGGAEGSSRSDNLMLDEKSLEVELNNSIQAEDYAQAARLHEELWMLHENNQVGIIAANA